MAFLDDLVKYTWTFDLGGGTTMTVVFSTDGTATVNGKSIPNGGGWFWSADYSAGKVIMYGNPTPNPVGTVIYYCDGLTNSGYRTDSYPGGGQPGTVKSFTMSFEG